MSKHIIFNQANGNVAICSPSPECLQIHTIEEIALKDVPAGVQYKIVDDSELPIEHPPEVWEIDQADLDDGVGGPYNMFPEDPQYPANAE